MRFRPFWLVILVFIFFCTPRSLGAESGSHSLKAELDSGTNPRPTAGASAPDPLKQDFSARATDISQKLENFITTLNELEKSGNAFPDPSLKKSLELAQLRIRTILNDGSRFIPGFSEGLADDSVLIDNIEILMEYGVEELGLFITDPSTEISSLKSTAASNIEKKWRLFSQKKKKNWIISNPDNPGLSRFGKSETLRRNALIMKSSSREFDSLISFLTDQLPKQQKPLIDSLKETAQRIETDPGGFVQSELDKALERVKEKYPEKAEEAKRMARDYDELRTSFDRWYDANIEDKSAEELGEGLLSELKSRSREVRNLESSIKAFVGDFPKDIEEAYAEFKKDPKAFIENKGEEFLLRLQEENPEKAEEIRKLIEEYKKHLKSFEQQLKQFQGKDPKEIGEQALQKLRERSQTLRDLEKDINKEIKNIESQAKKLEQEIQTKINELELRLDKDSKKIEEDAKRIGKDLEKQYENTRRKVENDLRTLLNR